MSSDASKQQNPYSAGHDAQPCNSDPAEAITLKMHSADRWQFEGSLVPMRSLSVLCLINGGTSIYNMVSLITEMRDPSNTILQAVPLQLFSVIGILGGVMLVAMAYYLWALASHINMLLTRRTVNTEPWGRFHNRIMWLHAGAALVGLLGSCGHWTLVLILHLIGLRRP